MASYFIFIIPQEPTAHSATREYLIGLNGQIRARCSIYRKRTDMEWKSVENFLNSEGIFFLSILSSLFFNGLFLISSIEIKSSFKRQMAARKKKVNKLKESQSDRIKLQSSSFLESLVSEKKFSSDTLV